MADYPARTIAVIGLSGCLPGARSVEEYWANLTAGVESISSLTEAELRAAGVSEEVLAQPTYVPRSGIAPDHEVFDAAFFGVSPQEARLMDPQQRLAMQHCYAALNHAGYAPRSTVGRIGVYLGAARS